MKTLSVILFAILVFFVTPASITKADDIDVAQITCKEFLDDTENMTFMLAWIDGYMSANSDNTTISNEWIEKLGTHMATYCTKNPKKTIMNAIDNMPSDD